MSCFKFCRWLIFFFSSALRLFIRHPDSILHLEQPEATSLNHWACFALFFCLVRAKQSQFWTLVKLSGTLGRVTGVFFSPVTTCRWSPARSSDSKRRRGGSEGARSYEKKNSVRLFLKLHIAILESGTITGANINFSVVSGGAVSAASTPPRDKCNNSGYFFLPQ